VIIDTPTLADLPALMVESKPMFDQMGFEEYGNGWEYDKMMQWWIDVISNPIYDIVVAREGNRLVGVSVVMYQTKHFWHTGPMKACEMAHHAAPDLPKITVCRIMIQMLAAITRKIKERGAKYFYIGYDPKPEFKAWGDYLMKKGFIDTSHVLMAKVGEI